MTSMRTSLLAVAKRSYGTGSLVRKHGAWYGRWRTHDGRQTRRRLAPASGPGAIGKKQAGELLRRSMLDADKRHRHATDPTVDDLAAVMLAHTGRKASTRHTLRTHLGAHILSALGDFRVSDVLADDVEKLIGRMLRQGLAPKTIRNVIGTLHTLMGEAVRQRIIDRNPCEHVALPKPSAAHTIRFLTLEELERLIVAAPACEAPVIEQAWWPVLRQLVLTAAMTGMRLGELRALTWADLDMGALRVRVARSYVRGQYGQPKPRRSTRAIPIASRLVSELKQHHRQAVGNQDSDLVLAHPHTGGRYPRSS